MNYNGYTPTTERSAGVMPNGRYQMHIDGVEETNLGGYDCVRVHIVSNEHQGMTPDVYTIFDRPSDPKKANFWDYEMTAFFDSFGIQRGDFNPQHWIGRHGTCDVYQRWDAKQGKSFAKLMPVRPNDPPTKDYLPAGASAQQQPSVQQQAAVQQGGFVPGNPAQVIGQGGFPEDIPF